MFHYMMMIQDFSLDWRVNKCTKYMKNNSYMRNKWVNHIHEVYLFKMIKKQFRIFV